MSMLNGDLYPSEEGVAKYRAKESIEKILFLTRFQIFTIFVICHICDYFFPIGYL